MNEMSYTFISINHLGSKLTQLHLTYEELKDAIQLFMKEKYEFVDKEEQLKNKTFYYEWEL